VFHEGIKHNSIAIFSRKNCTECVRSNDQLADVLTKSLEGPQIEFICSKLGTYNLYDLGRVLELV